MIQRILPLLIGYVCGWLPTGYLVGKAHGIDIREHGSGNIGMTNILRTLGVKAAAITLIGDVGKSLLATFLAWLIFHNTAGTDLPIVELYGGLGAVLGHNFPLTLKLKGGKGIASTVGVMILFAPFELPISVAAFFVIVLTTRYVSLGSIIGLLTFFVQTVIFGCLGFFGALTTAQFAELYILAGVIAALGIIRHHANIKRLIAGNENKIGRKKEETNG